MFTALVTGILLFTSSPLSLERSLAGPDGEGHMNNNLWTVLDEAYGDIGSLGAESSSMEFPGGSTDNHLYRGCDWIGLRTAAGETLVVANGLC